MICQTHLFVITSTAYKKKRSLCNKYFKIIPKQQQVVTVNIKSDSSITQRTNKFKVPIENLR